MWNFCKGKACTHPLYATSIFRSAFDYTRLLATRHAATGGMFYWPLLGRLIQRLKKTMKNLVPKL